MATNSLLRAGQEREARVSSHHLAFAAAKRGLDAAAPGTPAAAGYWLQLGDSAAAMGELELSYCLYARGWQQCCAAGSGAGAAPGSAALVSQLSARRLKVLGDLCNPGIPSTVSDKLAQRLLLDAAPFEAVNRSHPGQAVSASHHPPSSTNATSLRPVQSCRGTSANSSNASASSSSSSTDGTCLIGSPSSVSTKTSTQVSLQGSGTQPQISRIDTTTTSNLTRSSSSASIVPSTTTTTTTNSSSSSSASAGSGRVFCLSDLHVDQHGGANLTWLQGISTHKFKQDVLLVAGDVADSAAATRAALEVLVGRFRRVVWVPGNHELWVKPGSTEAGQYPDAFAKLMALRQMALEVGVDLGCVTLGRKVLVVPLLSWYNHVFDLQDPKPGRFRFDRFCTFPINDLDVWQVMLKLNTRTLAAATRFIQQHQHQQAQCSPQLQAATMAVSRLSLSPAGAASTASSSTPPLPAAAAKAAVASPAGPNVQARHGSECVEEEGPLTVITMSHFLPHPDLQYSRGVAELGKAVGCTQLLLQLQQVGSQAHVFGHTHINQDVWLPDPGHGTAAGGAASARSAAPGVGGSGCSTAVGASKQGRRYVQYALEAAGGSAASTIYCIWDGQKLVGQHVSII